jgi:hypothetical protein
MASQIDPDPIRKSAKPVAADARPPVSPKPAGRGPTPATPPKAGSVPPPPPVQTAVAPNSATEAGDEEAEPEARPAGRGFLGAVPAWAISMLVHVVAILVMALITSGSMTDEKPTMITSSTSEPEEEMSDFEDQPMVDVTQDMVDPLPDVVVTADVAVDPVDVVTMADDLDAAPLAVELVDFGSETAAPSITKSLAPVGGTGGGLGGRANPGQMAATGGGGKDTEEAVDRALKWIAGHQMPDGGWSFDLTKCPSCMGKCSHAEMRGQDRCGATAMALLPFLGRGYTHREGPYKREVEAGIGFLAKLTLDNKGNAAAKGGNLYSQGLAGIALSECFAMSQDNRLAQPAQLALNYIMDAQDPVGGGWRYSRRQPGDTSAVGWQIMALKSGNMAYLEVNPLTIKKAYEFLDSVQSDSGASYGYTGPGKGAGTSAVGLLCRMYLGWKKDHPGLQAGAERIAKSGPTKDLYFNYYATQIMHHMEGDMWVSWNERMKKLLLETQSKKDHEAGSWYEGVDSGHGARSTGRLYCTSLATMILEVYYRHLPIYRNQSVDEEFRE